MCQNCLRMSFLQDKSRLYVPTEITSSLTPLVFVNPFLYRNIEFTNTYLYGIWWETFFCLSGENLESYISNYLIYIYVYIS